MNWWNKYIGIPFVDLGRSLAGCDCYGLLRLVYDERLNVTLPSLLDYETTTDRQQMAGLVKSKPLVLGFDKINFDDVAPLDVLIIRHVGFDCHLGIAINQTEMIHAETGKGVVLEKFTRPHIRPRVKGVYRYAG